LKGEIFPS